MGFRVDETFLDRGAERLTTLAGEVSPAQVYVATHVDLNGLGDSGIFITAIGVLDQVRGAVESSLAHLHTLTTASADELRATARQYRATDDAADARMDQTYPGTAASPSPDGPR